MPVKSLIDELNKQLELLEADLLLLIALKSDTKSAIINKMLDKHSRVINHLEGEVDGNKFQSS